MWKRFFEWYLDIPPSSPGEGTSWRFTWHDPFGGQLPQWLLLPGIIAIAWLLIRVYRRETGELTATRRVLLASCRFAAIGVVLLAMTEASLQIDRTGLPFLILMLDDSASMGLTDQYGEDDLPAGMKASSGKSPARGWTRWQMLQSIIEREEGRWLQQLIQKYKLKVYRFSESSISLGKPEYVDSAEFPSLISQLKELEPRGKQTRPGPAVRQILNDFRGLPPSAIVLVTDGIASTHDGERLSTVADLASRQFVPFYIVGVGNTEPVKDVELFDVVMDDVSFVNDPLSITARVKQTGYAGKSPLLRVRDTATGEVLAQRKLILGSDQGSSQSVSINPVPPRAGEFDLSIEVVPFQGETIRDNNQVVRHVSVREEKIRVLLADSRPRYEFRFVKHLLEREPSIALHTVLQEADIEYAEEDATALAHFPVKRDEIWNYDVIIMGDVNPAYLSTSVYTHLREFVSERGGGLILIAGGRFNPKGYRGTPLENLFPFAIDEARVPDKSTPIKIGFRPEPTAAGLRGIPILRFAESDGENQQIWRKLPELFWKVQTGPLKTGATALLVEPLTADSNAADTIIAMQRFGGGKVLFHATDELWRWRLKVGDLYYGTYWIQAIRYLSRSQVLGQDRAAELVVDRSIYEQGEAIEIRARFFDERFLPVNQRAVEVVVERQGDIDRKLVLRQNAAIPTMFEARATDFPAGTYRAWISQPIFRESPPAVDFRIVIPKRELLRRTLDKDDLVLTARRTRGKYYSVREADRLPRDLPPGRAVTLETEPPIPLWNRAELMSAFVVLLTVEWLLRKRFRLA